MISTKLYTDVNSNSDSQRQHSVVFNFRNKSMKNVCTLYMPKNCQWCIRSKHLKFLPSSISIQFSKNFKNCIFFENWILFDKVFDFSIRFSKFFHRPNQGNTIHILNASTNIFSFRILKVILQIRTYSKSDYISQGSVVNLHKVHEWVWPWPWTFKGNWKFT